MHDVAFACSVNRAGILRDVDQVPQTEVSVFRDVRARGKTSSEVIRHTAPR